MYLSRRFRAFLQLSVSLRVKHKGGRVSGTGYGSADSLPVVWEEKREPAPHALPIAFADSFRGFCRGDVERTRREESNMRTRSQHWLALCTLAFAALIFAPNRAAADDEDPPGRVARLSFVRGQVSFSPSGTDDWVSAVVNRPITTGDKLWTDRDARVELHIGSAVARLSEQTGFSFLDLNDRITQIRLTEGTLSLRVRRMAQDETIEIDTPNLAFSILRPGRYRLNVNEAGDATSINVREGQGEVTGGGSAYTFIPTSRASSPVRILSMPTSSRLPVKTISIRGVTSATFAKTTPSPSAMSRKT